MGHVIFQISPCLHENHAHAKFPLTHFLRLWKRRIYVVNFLNPNPPVWDFCIYHLQQRGAKICAWKCAEHVAYNSHCRTFISRKHSVGYMMIQTRIFFWPAINFRGDDNRVWSGNLYHLMIHLKSPRSNRRRRQLLRKFLNSITVIGTAEPMKHIYFEQLTENSLANSFPVLSFAFTSDTRREGARRVYKFLQTKSY